MPLHPFIEKALRDRGPQPPLRGLAPDVVRAGFKTLIGMLPPAPDVLEKVENLTIASRPARLYRPRAGTLPLVLFFHGGGWVVGDLDSHDALCRRLAARGDCVVLSVDYRLAPEHPFPLPLDDAWEALRWAAANTATLGIDASRIFLAGDSAGGNLSAATALRARDRKGPRLRGQLLWYPAVDHPSSNWPSYAEMATGFGLTRDSMIWYSEQYLGAAPREIPAEAAPLRARDHSRLPPTWVATAEYDVLRDEGERYADVLKAAGVDATSKRYAGMNHGFVSLGGLLPEADAALADSIAWMRAR